VHKRGNPGQGQRRDDRRRLPGPPGSSWAPTTGTSCSTGWPAGSRKCAPAIAGVIERAAEPRLAAILAVLDRFDWEHDDRQYALEQIDRIAGGGS